MSYAQQSEKLPRRYDLDWLRVLVVLFVVFYHVGLIFTDAWVISNDRTSALLVYFLALTSFLRMPVLFFIAGAGTWFLLRRRTHREYLGDRVKRLGVPMVIGMLVLVPSQEYFLRVYYGGSEQSVLASWRDFLSSAFPAANYHWSHLWFIAYLLIFSILAYPLFMYCRRQDVEVQVSRLLRHLNRPISIFALSLPLILVDLGLRWKWPLGYGFIDDWARVAGFGILFIYGYFLMGSNHFWNAVDRHKGQVLSLAALSLVLVAALRLLLGAPSDAQFLSPTYMVGTTLMTLNGWLWLIAVLGYARKFLSFENSFLRYARDAGYPVYLLHHPIIIALAVLVVPWQLNPLAKFAVISVLGLGLTVIFYEFLVRRWQLMRFAFGLKSNVAVSDLPFLRRIGRSKRIAPEGLVLDGQPHDPR